eukprot:6406155-Ditylum_brightwellii.AAC.1
MASYDHGDSPQPIGIQFNKFWSEHLYPCQNIVEHGVMFPKVPLFHSSDSNNAMIWAIAALMCRVEAIWKN